MPETITSDAAFAQIARGGVSVLDVRSPKEFALGSFESALNIPLLNDEHRHLVGLAYKQKGSEAAVQLGHELVDPLKTQLQDQWVSAAVGTSVEPLVFCWRGGLRSQIACEWMREPGMRPLQVVGGFKALRGHALETFSRPWDLVVVCGRTGSKKTQILHELSNESVDLEALARHRGSAFGPFRGVQQPTQLNFENSLAVRLFELQQKVRSQILVEDESRGIGFCLIPDPFYARMAAAPCVVVDEPLEKRAQWIFEDYVKSAISEASEHKSLEIVSEHFLFCLHKIEKKLGGLQTQLIAQKMRSAFGGRSEEQHVDWIKDLLVHYYDKQYDFSFDKKSRPVLFQGGVFEVTERLRFGVK